MERQINMRVYTAPYVMHVPKDPDVLVDRLFDNARSVLTKVANHRPTLITLFESGSDYVAHYHVLVPDVGDAEIPSVKPIIDREQCDAFAMISLSEVQVSGNKEGHPEGAALFLVFHSNAADRMVYQTYRIVGRKGKKRIPVIKMGESFQTDKAIDLLGFGNLTQAKMNKPSYLG